MSLYPQPLQAFLHLPFLLVNENCLHDDDCKVDNVCYEASECPRPMEL